MIIHRYLLHPKLNENQTLTQITSSIPPRSRRQMPPHPDRRRPSFETVPRRLRRLQHKYLTSTTCPRFQRCGTVVTVVMGATYYDASLSITKNSWKTVLTAAPSHSQKIPINPVAMSRRQTATPRHS